MVLRMFLNLDLRRRKIKPFDVLLLTVTKQKIALQLMGAISAPLAEGQLHLPYPAIQLFTLSSLAATHFLAASSSLIPPKISTITDSISAGVHSN